MGGGGGERNVYIISQTYAVLSKSSKVGVGRPLPCRTYVMLSKSSKAGVQGVGGGEGKTLPFF